MTAAPAPTWTPYDYDSTDNVLPPVERPVWIHEVFYANGVTLGQLDQHGSWHTLTGSDDIFVTHWMDLATPDAP